jgi:galactokinase
MSRVEAEALYHKTFGREPEWISLGPGRINLIGEHTDYSGGYVFPAAINREVWVAAGPSADGQCRLTSQEMGLGEPFALADLSPHRPQKDWTQYPASMAWALGAKTPIQAAVASTLPPESGVSSSAAIELAFGRLWDHLEGRSLSPLELALAAQKGENQYVGVPCGIMDQMASAYGREGFAIFIDTLDKKADYAPLPQGVSIVLCNTGQRRELKGGEYKERRDQVEGAAAKLGVSLLRHATMDQLLASSVEGLERKRALHVISENARCLEFASALAAGDLARVGALLLEAHASMRDNFEATTPALDDMVEAAMEAGAIGARVTGAGFGGACVALAATDQVESFVAKAEEGYRKRQPTRTPDLIPCLAADGARMIQPSSSV